MKEQPQGKEEQPGASGAPVLVKRFAEAVGLTVEELLQKIHTEQAPAVKKVRVKRRD